MTELPDNEPFAGVFPIAPTPFTETGALDLEGQLVLFQQKYYQLLESKWLVELV